MMGKGRLTPGCEPRARTAVGGWGSALVATSDPDATCVRTPWNASLARCERASGRTDVCV